MAHTLTVWTVLAVLLLTATAQNTEDLDGSERCVSQQELAEVRRELDQLQGQLSYWQNNALTVIKDHVITGPSPQCSAKYPDSVLTNITQNIQEMSVQLKQLQQLAQQLVTNISQNTQQVSVQLEQLQQLHVAQQMKMMHSGCQQQIPMGTFQNPAPSCKHIHQAHPNSSSGHYWIQTGPGYAVQVYCDMERVCGCGGSTGWMRVADLHMTRQGEECPAGFRLSSSSNKRSCGRTGIGCVSTTFSSRGVEYSRVCGKVIGYQFGKVNSFAAYDNRRSLTLNDPFLDGVVLTHGSPRNHIWSFTATHNQIGNGQSYCPCNSADGSFTGTIPPFVDNDYFCDSGSRYTTNFLLYDADPLWDGEGCREYDNCCEFNNPPWFCKTLLQTTTDDIELRVCGNEALSNEDILIETVDIYIQ